MEDRRLMICGSTVKSPAVIKVQGSVDGGERTFPSTLSMLQLASR